MVHVIRRPFALLGENDGCIDDAPPSRHATTSLNPGDALLLPWQQNYFYEIAGKCYNEEE
ncbi:hypothetical protein NECAME_15730 [Necator americanus]|uniref:Uncharacterized protein n=1 Tax=Necator americanus TaxID=51031 RepID=W2SG90_NECAM|nr:hypothetical protein NECAME_15730 [Necator americanus]ETN68620.1 hypothetical protein NECAME_15730 [Necator americanus]